MKALLALLVLSLVTLSHAADAMAAVTAADDARVQATTHPDKAQLEALFSDDLRYAHSSGTVDTKASYIDTLLSGKTKYLTFDYEERKFTFPATDIALMTGRNKVTVENAAGQSVLTLSYLAVWRNENGHWRFLAWQSCKLPAPVKP